MAEKVDRLWMLGLAADSLLLRETYAELSYGQRVIQYFDTTNVAGRQLS